MPVRRDDCRRGSSRGGGGSGRRVAPLPRLRQPGPPVHHPRRLNLRLGVGAGLILGCRLLWSHRHGLGGGDVELLTRRVSRLGIHSVLVRGRARASRPRRR